MAITIQLREDTSRPAQAPEVRVKNYLELFQSAIQKQTRPEYRSSDLKDLESKIADDNKTSYETRRDLELVLWMAHISEHPDYVKASFVDGHPHLEILPKALELSGSDFVKIIGPLVSKFKIKCSVCVQEKNYTFGAILTFLSLIESTGNALKPEFLSPKTTYTLKLKDGKSRDFTRAEMFFLGLHKYPNQRVIEAVLSRRDAASEETCFDFSDVEDQTVQFLYDLFTLESMIFSQLPSDQLFRLSKYLKRPEVDSFFLLGLLKHLIGDPVSFLQSTKELILSEDCVERTNFQAETQAILAACPQATHVTMRQRDEFFLTLPRDTFQEFLDSDPAFFKNRTIKCKNDETVEVACDFYLEVMIYLSQASTLGRFKPLSEIDLSDFEKETIVHAYQWFKTGQYPTLSWREEAKLVSFLRFCSPDSSRYKVALSSLSKKIPCFTVNELSSMTWENLDDELADYNQNSYIQLGKEVYRIGNLTKLRNIPLQNLANPIYLKLPDASMMEGSLEWLSNPAAFLNSSQENPIPVTEEILGDIYEHSKTSLNYCQRKKLLKFFMKHAQTPRAVQTANIEFMMGCTLVNLGNAALPAEKYWPGVAAELHNLPRAQEIQLAGCEIVWPRDIVKAFIAHGNIPIEALSEMITLQFSDKDKVTIHRIYKAEWMCFTNKAPTEIKSCEELDGAMYCLSLIKKGTRRGLDAAELVKPWYDCERMARPFFHQKIKPLLQAHYSYIDRDRQPFRDYTQPSGDNPPPAGFPLKFSLPILAFGAIKWVWDKYQPSVSTVKELVLNKYTIVIGGCAIGAAYYIFSNRHRIRNAWARTTWKQTIPVVGGIAGAGAVGLLWMRFARKD